MPLCPPSGERSIPDARHNGPVANQRLKVLILGSTGSIGTQALEVIAANPDRFSPDFSGLTLIRETAGSCSQIDPRAPGGQPASNL